MDPMRFTPTHQTDDDAKLSLGEDLASLLANPGLDGELVAGAHGILSWKNYMEHNSEGLEDYFPRCSMYCLFTYIWVV